jgi:hypothetical protein
LAITVTDSWRIATIGMWSQRLAVTSFPGEWKMGAREDAHAVGEADLADEPSASEVDLGEM